LSELLDECLGPALAAQGFASADIVTAWPEIVGEKLAAHCEPLRIEWPRRPPGASTEHRSEPATLIVRTESAFSLDLQHQASVIVDRINARYGWRCVRKIIIKQGPVHRRPVERRRPHPDPGAIAAARERVGIVSHDGLREALVGLGAGIIAAVPGKG
jgi:hypothetical protein